MRSGISARWCAAVAWIAVALWMGFIFSMSAQTVEQSGNTSTEVTKEVAESVVPHYEKLSDVEKKDTVAKLDITVRKLAHFFEFAVLGALLRVALGLTFSQRLSEVLKALIAVAVTSLYAAGDEFHQLFVPGRVALFKDFLIDTAGGCFGVALTVLAVMLCRRIRKMRDGSRSPNA